jgi:hypothetical protein
VRHPREKNKDLLALGIKLNFDIIATKLKEAHKVVTLDLVESGNVHGLHVVLKCTDAFVQEVRRNLVILHHTADLQLLDTVRQWN